MTTRKPPQRITTHKRNMLAMMAKGMTAQEIGEELSLSVHTVNAHLREILFLLAARNRMHAVTIARDRGLL